ncbi:MAG: hypothetical protein JW996_06165 [Candidatus Cloacimonetes bacterium]|nr:hypothetical protein [Candidatus Cloacimonadota bacterium]
MIRLYIAYLIVGVVGLLSVILWGIPGMYSLNSGFLIFLFKGHRYDEREIQLRRRALNLSLGTAMILLINIYVLSRVIDFGPFLRHNWVGIMISGGFILHGLNGLIIFRNN